MEKINPFKKTDYYSCPYCHGPVTVLESEINEYVVHNGIPKRVSEDNGTIYRAYCCNCNKEIKCTLEPVTNKYVFLEDDYDLQSYNILREVAIRNKCLNKFNDNMANIFVNNPMYEDDTKMVEYYEEILDKVIRDPEIAEIYCNMLCDQAIDLKLF